MQSKHRKLLWRAAAVILACAAVVLSAFLIRDAVNASRAQKMGGFGATLQSAGDASGYNSPVDFVALQAKNPDIYAWIQVEGTNIDFPVVQHADDTSYYLTHTAERTASGNGSIYTEYYNQKDFSDFNTVVYGHNYVNGTTFYELKKFMDASFFNANRRITIYTPDQTRTYRIFAAYVYDDRHLLLNFDLQDPAVRSAYLQSVYESRDLRSHYDTEVAVTETSRIITLSTCINGERQHRYLVQGVLLDV